MFIRKSCLRTFNYHGKKKYEAKKCVQGSNVGGKGGQPSKYPKTWAVVRARIVYQNVILPWVRNRQRIIREEQQRWNGFPEDNQ